MTMENTTDTKLPASPSLTAPTGSDAWEILPIKHAVTTPHVVRVRREEALHWLRHGDKELRDRAERTLESLRHHPNSELSSGGPADKRQQTEQAARRLL